MKYEIRKILCNKTILIALFGAMFFSFCYSYYICVKGNHGNDKVEYADKTEYDSCLGEYTDEKYQHINQKVEELEMQYNQTNDEKILKEMFEYMTLQNKASNCSEVINYRDNIRKNAQRLIQSESGYYKALNKMIMKAYRTMPELRIEKGTLLEGVTGMAELSEIVDVVFIIVLILISCHLFINEHNCRTFYMIQSSYGGNNRIYRNKIFVVLILTLVIAMIQIVSMFSLGILTGGADEWKNAIQLETHFVHSPYNLSVAGMIFCIFIQKLVGYWTLISCFILISLFFKKNIVPLIINTIIGLGGCFLNYVVSGEYFAVAGGKVAPLESFYGMKKYSAFTLINDAASYLKEFEAVNVLGNPVSILQFNIIFNFILCSLLIILGYCVYINRFREKGV